MPWTSPFSLPGRWYKGNLHVHTTQSDGAVTPEQAIAWYRQRGYEFIAITDHWVLTRGRTLAPADDVITVTGVEVDGAGYHMVALGIEHLPDKALADDPRAIAAEIRAQGGLSFVAHPYWTGQTSAHIAQIEGLNGIEVYNTICETMDARGVARVHWDELLARGQRPTALAVDDTHWRKQDTWGIGFVVVRAAQLDEASILEALRQRHFYASTGPTLNDLRVVTLEDGRLALRVRCSPCQAITFYAAQPIGQRHVAPAGGYLDEALCPIRAQQVYLRVECCDGEGRVAWSNPVFVQDVLG